MDLNEADKISFILNKLNILYCKWMWLDYDPDPEHYRNEYRIDFIIPYTPTNNFIGNMYFLYDLQKKFDEGSRNGTNELPYSYVTYEDDELFRVGDYDIRDEMQLLTMEKLVELASSKVESIPTRYWHDPLTYLFIYFVENL